MGTHPIFESDFDCLTDLLNMIKLDRKRRKPKKEEEEEEERTSVDFCSDIAVGRLEAPKEVQGGLHLRRKSGPEDEKGEEEAVRKGPAMPPPEVLAQLQEATLDIQPEADEAEAKETEIPEKKDEPEVVPEKADAGSFKAPEA